MDAIVVAGFLGSGKTSFIRQLAPILAVEGWERVVVVENEVGKVDLDGRFLSESGLRVRQLPNGCVCCALRTELVATLRAIATDLDPQLVLIEPSGVAGPGQVQGLLARPEASIERLRTWVVLDGRRMRKAHFRAIPFVQESLAHADAVLVSKLDQLDTGSGHEVLAVLANDHARLPVIDARDETSVRFLLRRPAADLRDEGSWGKPVPPACAHRRWNLTMPMPDRVVAVFEALSQQVSEQRSDWLGHLKGLVTCGERVLARVSVVDHDGDVHCEVIDQDWSGPVELLVSLIVCELAETVLERLLDGLTGVVSEPR